jgi:hypothetical protein
MYQRELTVPELAQAVRCQRGTLRAILGAQRDPVPTVKRRITQYLGLDAHDQDHDLIPF